MNKVDIFSNATPLDGEWFYFKKVGDSIQGTFIAKRDAIDSFSNAQTVYIVKDAEGKVWNVAFRNTAVVIHERMRDVKFGQIVGFRFDEERDSKKTPGIKVKIIRVYADPKVVDAEWVSEHSAQQSAAPAQTAANSTSSSDLSYGYDDDENFVAPEDAGASSAGMATSNTVEASNDSSGDALQAIRDLAKAKGLVKDGMTVDEMNETIERYTGLKLTEENLTKIIISLTGYTG